LGPRLTRSQDSETRQYVFKDIPEPTDNSQMFAPIICPECGERAGSLRRPKARRWWSLPLATTWTVLAILWGLSTWTCFGANTYPFGYAFVSGGGIIVSKFSRAPYAVHSIHPFFVFDLDYSPGWLPTRTPYALGGFHVFVPIWIPFVAAAGTHCVLSSFSFARRRATDCQSCGYSLEGIIDTRQCVVLVLNGEPAQLDGLIDCHQVNVAA